MQAERKREGAEINENKKLVFLVTWESGEQEYILVQLQIHFVFNMKGKKNINGTLKFRSV